jgi:DNA-binding HxlR family transcriptional regulator
MNERCTVYRTADFIGKRWTIPILLEIYKGEDEAKRYSRIKSSIPGITPKILSERLKELEKEGLIDKHTDASAVPIKCEYRLTDSGREFIKIIRDLKAWALKWKIKNRLCSETDCQECTF